MISIEFECANRHRFEGFFKDHAAFEGQMQDRIIQCPLCNSEEVKRIYTGCSIQPRASVKNSMEKKHPAFFEAAQRINEFIKQNFEDVGREFADTARAIHYGIEDQRNIYGESTSEEIRELIEEGIDVVTVPEIEKINN